MRDVSQDWIDNQAADAAVPSVLSGVLEVTDVDGNMTRWPIDNTNEDNLVEATITSVFDPTRTTFPYDESVVVIENETEPEEGWTDTFDTLDLTRWRREMVWNGTPSHHAGGQIVWQDENIAVANGELVLHFEKDNPEASPYVYSSGVAYSLEPQLYGRWHIPAMRLVGARGVLAAFWLKGLLDKFEIDIDFPYGGSYTALDTVVVSIHNDDVGSPVSESYTLPAGDTFADNDHAFDIVWTSEYVRVYMGDLLIFEYSGEMVPHVPMYTIFWLGTAAAWIGAVVDADLPAYLYASEITWTPLNLTDFTNEDTQNALKGGGSISLDLGYKYDSGTVETKAITTHHVDKVTVSDDDMYVTIDGISLLSRLDDGTFYGGRYVSAGIPASTLFAEILDDVGLPNQGKWNYIIGDSECVVSYPTALFSTTGFTYYTIDNELDNVLVHIPIPPVSHRDALVMLAAYCGAYLIPQSDGSLWIALGSGNQTNYHFDENQVYERPKRTQGATIGILKSARHSYMVHGTSEQIAKTDIRVSTLTSATFTITHDACHGGSLELTGATLIGSPTYNTYSTVFSALPHATVFTATLTGSPVTIEEYPYEKTYVTGGEAREYNNPIASDPNMTNRMLDDYAAAESRPRYTFTMRDDPAVEVGDMCMLDTVSVPTGVPVVVTEIKRTMNGGIEAEYTVADITYTSWIQPDMVQTNMIQE